MLVVFLRPRCGGRFSPIERPRPRIARARPPLTRHPPEQASAAVATHPTRLATAKRDARLTPPAHRLLPQAESELCTTTRARYAGRRLIVAGHRPPVSAQSEQVVPSRSAPPSSQPSFPCICPEELAPVEPSRLAFGLVRSQVRPFQAEPFRGFRSTMRVGYVSDARRCSPRGATGGATDSCRGWQRGRATSCRAEFLPCGRGRAHGPKVEPLTPMAQSAPRLRTGQRVALLAGSLLGVLSFVGPDAGARYDLLLVAAVAAFVGWLDSRAGASHGQVILSVLLVVVAVLVSRVITFVALYLWAFS